MKGVECCHEKARGTREYWMSEEVYAMLNEDKDGDGKPDCSPWRCVKLVKQNRRGQ